ncbi:MAG: IS4 family transposase [Anaerolineales bacterium]|nr:IS4 family transposase [Anaerolineales bacterium]
MSINLLYDTWIARIAQLRPTERATRARNMAWFIVGVLLSRSVHLTHVAGKIPFGIKLLSAARRLERFLDNPAIRVREWYDPTARDWLSYIARTTGTLRLIADGTQVGFGHQLLMIAVVFHQRAIPICWTWVPAARGHSSAFKQLALLEHVRGLLPPHASVLLVGDSEFGAVDLMRQLELWHWCYVLRQKPNNQIQLPNQPWQNFGASISAPGSSRWLGRGLLTKQHAFGVNLLAHWAVGEKEAWLLATNLTDHATALKAYGYRMRIEEMFGDFKGHGFDLAQTHLRHGDRLSRLTLVIALLYTWLIDIGRKVIKNGLRHLVDRAERRDLSIFQIGLRLLTYRLTHGLALIFQCSMGFIGKLSGG